MWVPTVESWAPGITARYVAQSVGAVSTGPSLQTLLGFYSRPAGTCTSSHASPDAFLRLTLGGE